MNFSENEITEKTLDKQTVKIPIGSTRPDYSKKYSSTYSLLIRLIIQFTGQRIIANKCSSALFFMDKYPNFRFSILKC